MKLKKIASLMLAGVMAISMLAGCSNGSNNNDGDNGAVSTTGVSAASVIAKLDKKTTDKYTFSADASLEKALATFTKAMGDGALGIEDNEENREALAYIADVDVVTGFTSDKDAETRIFVKTLDGVGLSDSYAVRLIAEAIDEQTASWNLPENNKGDGNVQDGAEYVKYSYAGNMAVVKVENVAGQAAYVYAFTVTRTPTDAKVEL